MENKPYELPAAISAEEAAKLISQDMEEHRFVMWDPKEGDEARPIYIVKTKKVDGPQEKQHKELAASLVELRAFENTDEVRGGYCVARKGTVKFWGVSTTVPGADEKKFADTIASQGVVMIDQDFGQTVGGSTEAK